MSVQRAYSTAVLLCLLWAHALAVDPHGAHLRLSSPLLRPWRGTPMLQRLACCPHGVLGVADPDEVAPVEIRLCGAISVDALFSSSRRIQTTLRTGWGKGIANFTSSAEGKPLLQHLQAHLARV